MEGRETPPLKEISYGLDELKRVIEAEREENGYMFTEMYDMREPLQRITTQIRKQVQNAEYDLVIGDDASGRMPALVLGKFIAKAYKEQGVPSPQRLFFAGAGSGEKTPLDKDELQVKQDNIAEFLRTHKPGKRALVVTEFMRSQVVYGIRPLMNALTREGINYDLAVVNLDGKLLEKSPDAKGADQKDSGDAIPVHLGRVTSAGAVPQIYRAEFSGVYKEPKDMFSKIEKNKWNNPEGIQLMVNEARNDAERIANELFDNYKQDER